MWLSSGPPACDLGRVAALVEPRIERGAIGIAAGACGGLNLGPGGKAGIEQAHALEPLAGGAVSGEPPGLEDDGLLPGDAEPGEVGQDASNEPLARAAFIDVLDAQKKPAAGGARPLVGDERRERVTQVQLAIGARREAEDGFDHGGMGQQEIAMGPGGVQPRLKLSLPGARWRRRIPTRGPPLTVLAAGRHVSATPARQEPAPLIAVGGGPALCIAANPAAARPIRPTR